MIPRILRRFVTLIAALGLVACISLSWSGRLPLRRPTKVCAEVIDDLLELLWQGEIKPHSYMSLVPGLAHFAGALEMASMVQDGALTTYGGTSLSLEDMLYLHHELGELAFSWRKARSRRLHTHRVLLHQLQKYQAAVDLSRLPLWLGPPTPSTLSSLINDEVPPYLLALQEVIAVGLRFGSVLDHIQERSPNVFPRARNATGARLASSHDARRSSAGKSTAAVPSLDNWWSDCLALREQLLSFMKNHLREVSELHRRYNAGDTRSCVDSPSFKTSLYQEMDRALMLLQYGLPATFDATERETKEREARGKEETETWVSNCLIVHSRSF
ncbi:unnamed protein product [Peniophora sp. CBMAI 1063]|nr:unnamed protein product [Peniophora sp. CBMAI 1063]